LIASVSTKRGQRGATLILITFVATFVLVPIIGLAIDGALLFWMKARLSAAVDAAALAAGRSLNVGADEAAQEANAKLVAQQYFAANFPAGVMRSTIVGGVPTIVYSAPSDHVRTIEVTASAVVPLFFMPILHVDTGTISATGTASRRDANIILLLDRSGSMANGGGSCPALIASAQNFVTKFANGRDQLGLVTFSTDASTDFAPTLAFKPGLSDVLSKLNCSGHTSTAEGLNMAYHAITDTINQPGALNVILLFTDGSPTSILANYPVKTQADWRLRSSSNKYKAGTVLASSCTTKAPSLTGRMMDTGADRAATVAQLDKTGATMGLFATDTAGCSFLKDNTLVRQDIANVPATDIYKNATDGAVYPLWPGIDLFDSTNGPYAGLIRPDVPRTQRFVAFNAADAQAQAIHSDNKYKPVIYTIGLAGNEQMAMDQNFLERLANDPRANNYDRTKPLGQFIMATDNASMAAAFNQIASQVLRLSK